jgi:hypothetical protein
MTRLAQHDFADNLLKLLKETFEGGGNFYLERGAGLFPTLDTITAEIASREPFPGAPSIAAHCAHLDYYVRVNHSSIVGREQQVDWPSSWRVQSVGAGEWEALKQSLRSGYDDLRASLLSLPAWGDDAVCDSMAIVAHSAYHLSAIRQMRRLTGAKSNEQSSARDVQPN